MLSPSPHEELSNKFKRAEEAARKMLLLGAHSMTYGEDDEDIPEWVPISQMYWEHKKSHPSKSAVRFFCSSFHHLPSVR